MIRVSINLRDFEIKGNVLDISYKGSFVIPEMLETYTKNKIDKEFLTCEDEIACTTSIYNSAVAILSFNSITGEKRLSKLLLDIKRSLKNKGKFIICDLNVGPFSMPRRYNIMLKLPGEKIIKMKYTLGVNPFRLKFKEILSICEKCGFKVTRKKIDKGVYYIECLNFQEEKNENSISIT